jgi:hypothetical protein
MGMFAANEQAKEVIKANTSLTGLPLTASASMVAGFFASACSLPFDFVKTRIQRMKPDASGKMPYTGLMDCAMKVLTTSVILVNLLTHLEASLTVSKRASGCPVLGRQRRNRGSDSWPRCLIPSTDGVSCCILYILNLLWRQVEMPYSEA